MLWTQKGKDDIVKAEKIFSILEKKCFYMWIKKCSSGHKKNTELQERNLTQHIRVKILKAQNNKRSLNSTRERGQVIYEGKPIRITPDHSETLEC